jgi:phospholipid/cholesterol/gamma-HCH transport system permease protein
MENTVWDNTPAAAMRRIGALLIGIMESMGAGCILLVRAVGYFLHMFQRVNSRKVVYQLFLCGVASIPVVTITAMFTGMVSSAQVGYEMVRRIGSAEAIGALVAVSMVREMGPVLTAVVLAGFVGAGMTSVLATMKVNEEVDALEVMGIDPVRYLVAPRLMAMMVATPILVSFADWIGMAGGAVVGHYTLDVSYEAFMESAKEGLGLGDVLFGQIKAFVFGVIITITACHQGLKASGGAEGVGKATMRAVVFSFLLILVANFLLFEFVFNAFLRYL